MYRYVLYVSVWLILFKNLTCENFEFELLMLQEKKNNISNPKIQNEERIEVSLKNLIKNIFLNLLFNKAYSLITP